MRDIKSRISPFMKYTTMAIKLVFVTHTLRDYHLLIITIIFNSVVSYYDQVTFKDLFNNKHHDYV
jgi:hypothetical protein